MRLLPGRCFPLGGFINSRMAARMSAMARSCLASRFSRACSNSLNRRLTSRVSANASRMATKVRTTKIETSIARLEFSTLAAMSAPCPVKAYGTVRRPPQLEVANRDLKSAPFGRGQFKTEISGEAFEVAPHLFVETLGGHAIKIREVCVQNDAFAVNCEDAAGGRGEIAGGRDVFCIGPFLRSQIVILDVWPNESDGPPFGRRRIQQGADGGEDVGDGLIMPVQSLFQ